MDAGLEGNPAVLRGYCNTMLGESCGTGDHTGVGSLQGKCPNLYLSLWPQSNFFPFVL